MPATNVEYYTVQELANQEGVDRKTILSWIKKKLIKAKFAPVPGTKKGVWQIPKATYKRPAPNPFAPYGEGTRKGISKPAKPTTDNKAKPSPKKKTPTKKTPSKKTPAKKKPVKC